MKYFLLLVLIVIKISKSYGSETYKFHLQECTGQESVTALWEGRYLEFTCHEEEWLLAVERKDADLPVVPLMVKLVRVPEKENDPHETYNLLPSIPVSPEARWILRTHQLQLTPRGRH